MTNKQESRLKMYLAVKDFLVQNDPLTKDLPEFPASYTELQDSINQIQLIDEQQKDVKTGIAKDKKELKNTLIYLAADNSGKVFAFATISKNKALMDEVNFSISDLGRMTDVAIKSYAEALHKKVEANIDALAKYGITVETQKVLEEALSAYNNSLAKPRVGIAEKRKATKQLAALFITSDAIVEKIDAIIGIIRYNQVNFFNGYKTVRKLVDTNTGVIALRATAIDVTTGEPVKGAIFTFTSDGTMTGSDASAEITKKTANKGSFHIKNMQPGTYKVIIRKPGFKEKIVTVSISGGERSDLNVELEKA